MIQLNVAGLSLISNELCLVKLRRKKENRGKWENKAFKGPTK
jgi:hypothetical protein